ECSDRRLVRATAKVALSTVVQDRAEVTLLLPRRTFHRISQRILHDRTADRIAEAIGRIPHVAATIVPFDTTLPPELEQRLADQQQRAANEPALLDPVAAAVEPDRAEGLPELSPPSGVTPIGTVKWKQQVTIEGRIKLVQVGTAAGKSLEAQVFDSTGGVRLLFLGRTQIPGIEPGAVLRATGRIGEYKGHLALANPRYELVDPA
ncbi:MAG: OB-fold nucleic acid binding domain-containing protein, partial [Jatrophihabitantaceae bacterium]